MDLTPLTPETALTPSDIARLTAQEKKRWEGFNLADELVRLVIHEARADTARFAFSPDHAAILAAILNELSDGMFEMRFSPRHTVESVITAFEESATVSLEDAHANWAEEGGLGNEPSAEIHPWGDCLPLCRKLLALTPYSIWVLWRDLTEHVASTSRETTLDLITGRDDGTSVRRAAEFRFAYLIRSLRQELKAA